ncbi:MAG: UDP-N-acetylglucosamine 1-carboxyvinyltransferase, partial [Acidobacteria bacterium]|nr:UDP-N-acetylglucosamine 1-carboxyvinyltransferase [Acidobacteriota bacterium]
MNTLSILGPQRLVGTVHVAGAKNAALPALAATLLASEAVTLERIPRVTDTATMLDLLTCLGVEVRREGEADCLVPSVEPDRFATWGFELMRRIRASILVLGPLVARRGRARVALPGGCAIGTRPIDEHLRGLSALGAEVRVGESAVEVTAPGGLRGSRFRFSTPSVTATENLLMAASLARGTSILEGCAQEPEIGDLV